MLHKIGLAMLLITSCGKHHNDRQENQATRDHDFQNLDLKLVVPMKDEFQTGEKLSFRMHGSHMDKVRMVQITFLLEDHAKATRTLVCNAESVEDDIWQTVCDIKCVEGGSYMISSLDFFGPSESDRVRYALNLSDGLYHRNGHRYGPKSTYAYSPFQIKPTDSCLASLAS